MLVILSGVSGAGKTVVLKELIARNKGSKILRSFTTRTPRSEDEHDFYNFISDSEFLSKQKNDELVEWVQVHGSHFYATGKKEFETALNSKDLYIKDVDVKGVEKLQEYCNKDKKLITFFLVAPKDLLKKRLIARGDTLDIEKRLSRFDYEMSFLPIYDYAVDSYFVNETADDIMKILNKRIGNLYGK